MPKAKSAGPITPTIPNPVNMRTPTRSAGSVGAFGAFTAMVLKKR